MSRDEAGHNGNPFMARPIQLSLDNVVSGQGGPFSAVIVKNGSIVAEGVNRVNATNAFDSHGSDDARTCAGRLRCVGTEEEQKPILM